MLSFDIFQRKIHSFVLKGHQELFENHLKKFWFPKSCPHKKLAEQIFHIQPPNSSMLWFGMFQWKIRSVLLKGCHKLFDNRPKKFWFPKSCPQEHCPGKYFTFGHQIQVCCALVCSNERSTAPCSKRIMNYSKITQRKFDFPKVVHIHHCLSKYFTYSHQIQVCSALVCSNERSTASCSKTIMNYWKIAKRKFDFPNAVHIYHCPSKYSTYSHQSQVCCALICSNERSIPTCSRAIMNCSKIAQEILISQSCPQRTLPEKIL